MSVTTRLDLATGRWADDVQPESASPQFKVGFTDRGGPVVFDVLTFGFVASVGGQQVASVTYPPDGVTYLSTDQPWMTNDRISAGPGDTVTVEVWAVNAGMRHEHTVEFTLPEPEPDEDEPDEDATEGD